MNFNWTSFYQKNVNYSDNDAVAASLADSGGNLVVGGLVGANILNPATSTAAAVNLSPIAQSNLATDFDSILDAGIDIA